MILLNLERNSYISKCSKVPLKSLVMPRLNCECSLWTNIMPINSLTNALIFQAIVLWTL